MNIIKKSLIFSTILILFSCGTSHNYTMNNLNQNFYQNKTIYFILDTNSIKEVKMSGLYTTTIFDDNYPPIVEDVFKESIEELAKETKFDLKFIKDRNNISSNEIVVEAKISEISWHFGFSRATFRTKLEYNILNSNDIYETDGIRKSGGGSKTNNLRKSLKDANYKFLKKFEK
ncbi:hypothetical protein [Flavobacterium lacisediminis]|uniref:DUF4136 domain-containing protein n=1 Tax=Flavobacterium lacisediminis TaxID=2989705 RepID=A0ABT3EG16_9FLAO|nr:hypothetical protein [Flavobacterium lacisediminis]MCW1147518.1 hypothetical protein [Flavobacterium lacisediminis]